MFGINRRVKKLEEEMFELRNIYVPLVKPFKYDSPFGKRETVYERVSIRTVINLIIKHLGLKYQSTEACLIKPEEVSDDRREEGKEKV